MAGKTRILASTRYLSLVERDDWFYVTRPNARSVVAIVAWTPEREIVLVEQHRVPVRCNVIELPAGLVGDSPGSRRETSIQAARRELREETGCVARSFRRIMRGVSSAGLTDETVELFLARDVRRVNEGGGEETESIIVHFIPLGRLDAWLNGMQRKGRLIDFKVPLGAAIIRDLKRSSH